MESSAFATAQAVVAQLSREATILTAVDPTFWRLEPCGLTFRQRCFLQLTEWERQPQDDDRDDLEAEANWHEAHVKDAFGPLNECRCDGRFDERWEDEFCSCGANDYFCGSNYCDDPRCSGPHAELL